MEIQLILLYRRLAEVKSLFSACVYIFLKSVPKIFIFLLYAMMLLMLKTVLHFTLTSCKNKTINCKVLGREEETNFISTISLC